MNYEKKLKELGISLSEYAFPELKPGDQDWRWCHKYAHDILTEKIPAGLLMKQAAFRHFSDMSRTDLVLDEQSALSIVSWFKFVPITDGKEAGKSTILLPWQIWVVVSLIAWKWRYDSFDEDGNAITVKDTRRFNQSFILISRKAGKTTLAAGIILYLMYKSGYQPRAYSVATKRDQAKLLWNTAKLMIKLSPRLSQIFQPRANDILMPDKFGEFRALASDSNQMDGLNPIAISLDELHAYKDRNLYGVMVSAFGAQVEYLMIGITTAGFVLDGLCIDLYKNGQRVLDPKDPSTQDNYFYAIWQIDKEDDWTDPQNWYKSNAGLSYGLPSMRYLKDRYAEASLSTEEKANFLTKHCNIFVSGSDKWLDIQEVKANCVPGLDISKYYGKKCWVGIDRARIHDICSFSLLFPDDDGGATIFWINLLPSKTVEGVSDYLRGVYHKAIENDDLRVTMTPTVTKEDVKRVVGEIDEMFDVQAFCYDPWHMTEIANELEEMGYKMVSVSQGTGNMSEPAKMLEGLIKEKKLRYDSVLFEYACGCAMMNMTRKNNMEVYRENDKVDKIDPLISLIIALSAATLKKLEVNIYETRGMLSV